VAASGARFGAGLGLKPAASNAAAYLLLTLAVLAWAGNFVIGRALRLDAPPAAMTFWRWLIALALLLPFTYGYLRDNARQVRRSWRILCLLGLLATVLQHIPLYLGLRYTTATNGALLNATSPIFIAFLAAMAGERLGVLGVFGIGVALAGVLTVVSRGDPALLLALSPNPGDVWVLLGTLAWSVYTVCLRWWPAGLDRLGALAVLAAVGVVAAAPLYALEMARGELLQPSAGSIAGLLYIGIFATVVGYIFWNSAVAKVGPARAGPFMYLMLVFTPLLSIVFLDEELELFHLTGAVLIVAGIILATSRRVAA
jgi:drug/metabolite transporter (DMT)-like permease